MATNYRYEIVFRTIYLDDDFQETGVETGAILFQKESGNALCVEKNIKYSETHANGETTFKMQFDLPRECD